MVDLRFKFINVYLPKSIHIALNQPRLKEVKLGRDVDGLNN